MPSDVRHRTTIGNRFRLLARVLGLTGIMAFAAGAVLASTSLPPVETWTPEYVQAAAQGADGVYPQTATLLLGCGLIAVVLWLVVELLGGLFLVAGRKTVVGTNALVQIALAVALLVIVNVYSFSHYARFDLTRDAEFTLPDEQIERLRQLRSDAPTTVVVLQLHETAGTLSEKPDAYDYAAERKVVEKVRDLVDQLREFGPQFNVVVLDVEDERYERTLRDLTRTRPGLADVIRDAPENSIFFYADGKVRSLPTADADRLAGAATVPDPAESGASLVYPAAITRMSFAEFYQLDKTASREATPAERERVAAVAGGPAFAPGIRGTGNLVLIPQGRETFVRKVLALEDRKPRVALAVIHPVLTSRETSELFGSAGLRASLEANGFEVTDVILKKNWAERTGPTPAAYTYEETELDRVEAQFDRANLLVYDRTELVKELRQLLTEIVEVKPLPELDRLFRRQFGRPVETEADRTAIREVFENTIRVRQEELAAYEDRLAEVTPRYKALLADEGAVENRRMTDLKAKFGQYVADADILIVPRMTVIDVSKNIIIPPDYFALAKEHAEVVKEFVAAGKPVLFAFGPTNIDPRGTSPTPTADDIERLLPRLGIDLGRQTIISNAEAEAMAERSTDALASAVAVPALVFDPPASTQADGDVPNPIGGAFRVTSRAVGKELPVTRSGFRPVYLAPGFAAVSPFATEVMFTTADTWNEPTPVPADGTVPKFDPPQPGDPSRGTLDEERRGPFPVGVAVEVPVPAEWVAAEPYPDQQKVAALLPVLDGGLSALGMTLVANAKDRPTVRVVAYGHGGLFTGDKLTPAQETLLLHTVNWQLRREDRLPVDTATEEKWRFPRAGLSAREYAAWRWGTFLGLPLVCVYFGLIVLMVRKVR